MTIRLYIHEKMDANFALYARLGYAEIYRGTEKGLSRAYMAKALEWGGRAPGPSSVRFACGRRPVPGADWLLSQR